MNSNFFIKLTNWEFWPFGVLQGPVFVYWIWLSLKARSLFFFSASNPGILAGGMMGESKADVMERIPASVKPTTVLVKLPATIEDVVRLIEANGMRLPVIFKPDLGERGWMVRKIQNRQDIGQYLSEIRVDFIIQELVTLPLEFGVFYYRMPDEENGVVNSITLKEFLSVTGDGAKSLRELIQEKPRAKIQWETLRVAYKDRMHEVLAPGERVELVSIGNHCLGTKFINANHLITPELTDSFNRISRQIKGFNFGRFDLRCATTTDLTAGNVKIVELNGSGAEPAHIYDPSFSFFRAMGVLFSHVRRMYLVSKANHERGVPYLPFREGRAIYRKFKALKNN